MSSEPNTPQRQTNHSQLQQSDELSSAEYLERLEQVTEELTRTMEKTRIAEYVQYLNQPGRLLWSNFLIGIARGLGSTIGLAIVLGLLLFFLKHLLTLNLPIISDFIADFIFMVQENYNILK